jgi:hypothetical protein
MAIKKKKKAPSASKPHSMKIPSPFATVMMEKALQSTI